MDAGNKLDKEIKELSLLVNGLSKVSGFPSELLELIRLHTENISELVALNNVEDSDASVKYEDHVADDLGEVPEVLELQDRPEIEGDDIVESKIYDDTNSGIGIVEPNQIEFSGLPRNGKVVADLYQASECLNDRSLEPKAIINANKMLTLNDRFRFQRELFGNDALKMNESFDLMIKSGSVGEALSIFEEVCPHGSESDCYPDFYLMLEQWFPDDVETED